MNKLILLTISLMLFFTTAYSNNPLNTEKLNYKKKENACFEKYKNSDFNAAMPLCRTASKLGSADATLMVGLMLGSPHLKYREKKKSLQLIKKAADNGSNPARILLGIFYYRGMYFRKNINKARFWFKKAIDDKDPFGVIYMAYSYWTSDKIHACELLLKMNQKKNWRKSKNIFYHDILDRMLGTCYQHGYYTTQNREKALKYFTLAANKGDAVAAYRVAQCYHYGIGTPVDIKKAVFWYKKSVDMGFKPAYDFYLRLRTTHEK